LTYLHSDHLGTTRLGTKEDGTVAFKTASMPFGEILQQTDDSLSRPKGFAVHARDEGSSLVYMKARSYSPGMGRFASADPGQAGALLRFPETWNGYSYVYNQPTLFVDPTGRCIWDLCIGETALAYYATLGVATIVAAAIAANPEQAQANAQNLLNSARDLTRRLPPTRQPTVSPAPNPDFNPFDFRGGGRPPDLTPKFRQIMRAGVVFGAFVGVMKIWDMTSEFWQGNPPSAPYTTDVITTVTTYHLDPETGLPVPDGPSFEHVETETETQIGPAPDNLPPAQGIENFSSRYGDNDFRWNSRRRPPKMYH
jgi:RHS repeat-associated protein